MLPEAKTSTLVYVTDSDLVYAYAYPSGILEGTIYLSNGGGYVNHLCSDDQGDVWVTDGFRGSSWSDGLVLKYKHGGTKPIETLSDNQFPVACAVDESTGDLAVVGQPNPAKNYNGGAAIYPGGQGKPTYYRVSGGPISCTYDSSSDLFVVVSPASKYRALIWLKKGRSGFKSFLLHPEVTPYGVRWDGTDLALAVGNSTIDRFEINGGAGKEVSKTVLDGKLSDWWIANNKVFGTYGDSFAAWHYPKGGEQIKDIEGPSGGDFGSITVSTR